MLPSLASRHEDSPDSHWLVHDNRARSTRLSKRFATVVGAVLAALSFALWRATRTPRRHGQNVSPDRGPRIGAPPVADAEPGLQEVTPGDSGSTDPPIQSEISRDGAAPVVTALTHSYASTTLPKADTAAPESARQPGSSGNNPACLPLAMPSGGETLGAVFDTDPSGAAVLTSSVATPTDDTLSAAGAGQAPPDVQSASLGAEPAGTRSAGALSISGLEPRVEDEAPGGSNAEPGPTSEIGAVDAGPLVGPRFTQSRSVPATPIAETINADIERKLELSENNPAGTPIAIRSDSEEPDSVVDAGQAPGGSPESAVAPTEGHLGVHMEHTLDAGSAAINSDDAQQSSLSSLACARHQETSGANENEDFVTRAQPESLAGRTNDTGVRTDYASRKQEIGVPAIHRSEPKTAQVGHRRPARPRKHRRPTKYQAAVRTPDALTAPREPRAPLEQSAPRARALSVAVHVTRGLRNRYQISLLPERADGLEATVTVQGPQGDEEWNALQDEWYADLIPDGLGRTLRDGAQWEAAGEADLRWALARGREIYVLVAKPESGVHGFVMTTRLLLREEQLVLCTREQEETVRRALADAGCPAPSSLGENAGIPAGWLLFENVRPTTAVPHSAADGILNVLRPVHAVEIELRGGIRVERMKWLDGHPPEVRLRGDHDNLEVTIDQQIATRKEDGTYIVPGWQELQVHRVFCGGATASYELVPAPLSWERFSAITYRRTGQPSLSLAVCGPLVQSLTDKETVLLARIGSTCLLGAVPGQIAFAEAPFDVRVPSFLAAAQFPVVWAVPAVPLQANKATSTIQLLQHHSPEPLKRSKDGRGRLWAYAIMDASYKRLHVEPATDDARRLWAEYKRTARHIKRQLL